MRCHNCGRENKSNATYCGDCGYDLHQDRGSGTRTFMGDPNNSQPSPGGSNTPSKKVGPRILINLVFSMVVFVGVFAFVLFGNME